MVCQPGKIIRRAGWRRGTKLFSLGQTNPDLGSAQSLETRSGNYWLVPLPGDMRYRNYRQGYRKLAIKRDSAGRIYARILEIIPDGLYFQRKGRASTPDFTGRIFVYDQHYHLLGGRLFSEGKVTGDIKTAAKSAAGNGLQLDNVKQVTTCTWYNDNYVNAEGEVTIYSERICSTTTIDDGSTGGGCDGGSGDYLGSSPAGGGGGTSASPPADSNLPGESGAHIRPRSYMDCFSNIPDAGASMKITVFVQEPFPGTSFNIGPNSMGHVAIGLTKSNGSQSVTQVVGYYPNASGIYKYHCPSKVVNNSNLEFDVSISYNVSANAFQQITNYISSPPTIYDLMDFNCTNFVYSAC